MSGTPLISAIAWLILAESSLSAFVRMRSIAVISAAFTITPCAQFSYSSMGRPKTEDGMEDVKFIGAYPSEAWAQAAVERPRTQPEFPVYPDDFTIDVYGLDNDH